MKWTPWLLGLAVILLLSACGTPQRRPSGTGDGPPRRPVNVRDIQEPVPQAEPKARYGNHSPYTVNGRTYHVLASSEGYQERGLASWYGRKFHGQRTSSGEIFDLEKVTAAHRTLPLPTYVEVTNLDNDRSIIARVNDRGPFHDDRILDLSYAAAVKLGFAEQGTARVEVRAINVLQAGVSEPPSAGNDNSGLIEPTWLQIGAFSEQQRALEVQRQLRREGFDPVTIVSSRQNNGELHRVRLGPFHREADIQQHASRLGHLGLGTPVRVSLECQPQGLSC